MSILYLCFMICVISGNAFEEETKASGFESDEEDSFVEDYFVSFSNNQTNRNDTIPLFRHMDNEFYTQIVIGRPGQTMNVVFDTTLPYSWLLSAGCDLLRVDGCRFHNRYDHRLSSHYKRDGTTFSEEKSELAGYYSSDNVTIGQSKLLAYSFVEMTKVPSSFAFNKADGVFGLGAKNSFFHYLHRIGRITRPIFSVFLNRNTQSNRAGSIMLGYYSERHIRKIRVNNTNVQDKIKYLKVDDGDHWSFSMDRAMVVLNPTTKITLCERGCKAIANTVSGRILGPTADIKEINYQINARLLDGNTWVVNCDTINTLPRIDFVLDGQTFSLAGRNYILKVATDYTTVCVSAFTPSTDTNGSWVLGAAFLSQFYSIYDIEKRTVGFVRTPN